ncbi:MAG: chemosensory pili system protein ChpA (sensor histidine kinase/response regulator) [Flavobacteriales bacterium]|jgi:chemosensory pili system protein ChpA (sensor histidine kinase/response regulator)
MKKQGSSMGEQRNYAALDWVMGEIEETLNEARQALEAYVADTKDTTRLRFCITHIHQVRGSLQIVEFRGASLLAEEMEFLAQAIMDQKVTNDSDAQEVLMRSLLQLPIYLDHVKVYREDSALAILPLLNDLRATRNESYLSESDIFSPDLSALDTLRGAKHVLINDVEKLKQVTKKLREMYQFAAASVLRDIKVDENLEYIDKVFSRLEVLSSGTAIGPLWQASAALIEGLKNDEIELSVSVAGILRHLARELRLLSEQAPKAFDLKPREGLFKNILYYVARADSTAPRIQAVKDLFGLRTSDVHDNEENVDGYNVSALDPEAVRSVVIALREELKSIKSTLDTALTTGISPSEISEILPVVKRVGDTLSVLGIGDLRLSMLDQADRLEILSKQNALDESHLTEIATQIIDVDHKLEAIGKAVDRHRDLSSINERTVEIDEAKLAVIRECTIGLERAKDAIIEYISDEWDTRHLEHIEPLLTDVRGGLDMIPLPRPAAVIASCLQFILEKLKGEDTQPEWKVMEKLAEAMASVEYYLECISGDMSEDAIDLLDVAEESLRSIGYAVHSKESSKELNIEEVLQAEVKISAVNTVQVKDIASPESPASEAECFESFDDADNADADGQLHVSPAFSVVDPIAIEVPQASGESVLTVSGFSDDEDDIDEDIIEVFIEEVGEVLETLTEYLPRWAGSLEDEESLTVVRRAFHTLKGSGRMVKAMEVGELSWSVENMLNRIIDRSVVPSLEHTKLAAAVVKVLPVMVVAYNDRTANPEAARSSALSLCAFALAEGKIPSNFNEIINPSAAKKTATAESAIANAALDSGASDEVAVKPHSDGNPNKVIENTITPLSEEAFGESALVSSAYDDDDDDDDDDVLLEIFSQEAETHLSTIDEFVMDMEDCAPLYTTPTDALQRALHTLKGSARMAQVAPIAEMFQALEAFAKELVTFQVVITDDILQLIRDGQEYTAECLRQLSAFEAVEMPRLEQFLARTKELRELAVGSLIRMKEQQKDGERPVDPQLLSIFMAEEMRLFLDADEILDKWLVVDCRDDIQAFIDELYALSNGAEQAKLPDMSVLSLRLISLLDSLLAKDGLYNPEICARLKAGHSGLLDLVDSVAAGQNVMPVPQDLHDDLEELQNELDLPVVQIDTEAQQLDSAFYNAITPFIDDETEQLEAVGFESEPLVSNSKDSLLSDSALNNFELDDSEHIGPEPVETLEGSVGTQELVIDDDSAAVESIEVAEPADVIGAVEANELAEVIESYEVDEFAEVIEVDGVAEANELAEVIQADEVDEPAEVNEAVEATELAEQRALDDELSAGVTTENLESYDSPEIVEDAAVSVQQLLQDQLDAGAEDFDPDILDIFLEEAQELLESLDEAISEWERDPESLNGLEEMKRALHTMKGGARLSGLTKVGDLVHDYETYLIELDPHNTDAEVFETVHNYQDQMDQSISIVHRLLAGEIIEPPAVESPTVESPTVESPTVESPTVESSTVESSTVESSTVESSAVEVSASDEVSDVVASSGKDSEAVAEIEIEAEAVAEIDAEIDAEADIDAEAEEQTDVSEVVGSEQSKVTVHADDASSESSTSVTKEATDVDRDNVIPFAAKPRTDVAAIGADFEMPAKSRAEPSRNVASAKKAGPQEVVRVSSELLEELVNLAGETSISRSRLEEQVTEFRFSLEEVDSTINRLQEQLRRLDIETEAQVLFRQEQLAVHEVQFDPLEMDRYSALQQLSRSLTESASDLHDLRSELTDKVKGAETILLQQSRINTTLQEGLMRSRMVPFSRMVPRLRRIVRQVASELGKKVSLELDNVEGELDRNVLERMVPPFEHMLRNAVDHGIEDPEARIESGKSETGRIVLTLGREGSDVIIRLADDGIGVDLKAVRAKAIERGLMTEDAELSDYDIMQFILHAGFSTAESVTQISGRGVGMDVVHAEIKQLGGDVAINSKWGKGTEFVIRLPFTLSVNRALMTNIGQDHYAIPLNAIEGIVRISPFELEHYYDNPEAEFEYANEKYKVRYLGSMLYPGAKPQLEGHTLPLPIILVRTAQHAMALQVDGLLGSREVVVKSLGQQFSTVQGLSGATVMGDGSVVVILDPHALVRQEIANADLLIEAATQARLVQGIDIVPREEEKVFTVMVVDDSVTVRKVTTRFLEREGFNVITAKDGVDALQILQDTIPDLMLLDIEMPRMDGFEVAKNIRTTQRWKHLPVIMITSRTGAKHRDHALNLGVNHYMGKPYQEDMLLEAIDHLIPRNNQ